MQFWITIGLILVLSALGLTYEIAAGRVLAPFFGTSLLTWTTVIATILAGFSLGSALGGLVAEQPPRTAARNLRRVLVATAVLMALSPTVLGIVYLWGARGTFGMFIAVFIAFFPASVLVSFPSPYLAKRAVEARPGREGSSLGLVLAAGSLGAILGAVLAGFVTLPLAGSVATFAGCGAIALLCLPLIRGGDAGSEGDATPDRTTAVTRTVIGLAALLVAATLSNGSVCRYESGLSCIDVTQQGGVTYLYSDRTQQAAESTTDARQDLVLPYTQYIWSRMQADLGPAPQVLFIGGGGYSLPAKLIAADPDARAIAVEIDPLITEVARNMLPQAGQVIARSGYMADAATDPATTDAGRLGIVHADGRVFLNETTARFDAVVMDAFSSGSVPAHLATLQTYARIASLTDGPVYVNLIDQPDGRLARGLHAILRDIFSYVEIVQGPVSDRGRANILMAAAHQPLDSVDSLPPDYAPVQITAARAFTDDRGWVGHR